MAEQQAQCETKGFLGSDAKVLVALNPTDVFALVAEVTNMDRSGDSGVIEMPHRDCNGTPTLPGKNADTMNISANHVLGDPGQEILKRARNCREKVYVKLLLRDSVGAPMDSSSGSVTNVSDNYPDQEGAPITFSLRMDGWTPGVVKVEDIAFKQAA